MGTIIPAIDIMGGKAVRLLKGDYNSKTIYGDPIEIAQKFMEMGAKRLHVVDLDGARGTEASSYEIVARICEGADIPVQIGGGIRSRESVEKYLQIADRVILGTIAVKNPRFVGECIREYGADRIVVGADVLRDEIAISGWAENSGKNYLEFVKDMKSLGVETIIATDISKDGTLTSPNWEMYEKIKGVKVIVSGGVACNEDCLKAIKYHGVIVGKAYYEGKVDLEWLLKNV
ncbi:MAG: 1-(5-phosphoribosyl)-5-[(5-phosphoribosylamino)methylideneamino]imidazole-4-carboxamide isomerase [Clostridiales bacterium]|nr:1-(5-phosphoribosyl)-5-[(5-phosphoribosylamino)methylideneamino]imidazole-4-carboxamide isomerase [Clostridiales bacterium]